MQRPKVYATDHVNSRVVCKAFADGCNGQIVPPRQLLDGPAAMYGVLRGCGDIIRQCQWVGRDFYHIDHGYFRRGLGFDGYYRITRNGFQAHDFRHRFETRFASLNVEIKPWRSGGRHVVVIPLTGHMATFLGIDGDQWLNAVTREISHFTDRPIVENPKEGSELKRLLEEAHILVTHSSNAAVDAIMMGVPVIALGPSACLPVSTPMEEIETPRYPDREPWAWDLACRQFNLDEMRSGEAWKILNE